MDIWLVLVFWTSDGRWPKPSVVRMDTSRRKLLLLHVGTHKTATTSLQAALVASSGELASDGTLYPETGRIHFGHHNIAWGLIGDERFDRLPAIWMS